MRTAGGENGPVPSRESRWLYVIGAVTAAAGVCLGAYLIDRSEVREHEAARRLHVQANLSQVRARLEMELNGRIHLARGLEALAVALPELSQREFEAFAHVMVGQERGIRSLQLARGGVVSHIYPEAGNEAARGHSLLTDPAVAEAAQRAVSTRNMSLAGPYALRQGGQGLVARLPIFLPAPGGGERFWGFATVVIDFPTLVAASGIAGIRETEFAIRGKDGNGRESALILGANDLFAEEHLATEVRFPNGHWVVAARPAGGWTRSWPGRNWFLIVTVLLLSAIPIVTAALSRASHARAESDRLGLRDRLLNSLDEGVYGVDAAGRCTFANPAALRLLGYTREEVVGADTRELFHGPIVRGESAGGGHHEESLRRKDGTLFPADVRVAAMEGGDGAVVAFSDITQRKSADERLRLAAIVFARTQQGIMITNAAGELLDVNPAFTDITGYAREEVLGRNPKMLSSGRQSPEFYAAMKDSLAATGFWRGELWNRHKSGKAYPELLSIAAVDDGRGGASHYIGVFSDISRQKQHEAELARIAHYDALTALPNRALLSDRLAQALEQTRRSRSRLAVCMLDLDHFKLVNDELGHDTGDAVLAELAARLKATLRSGDTVARLGGDEFVLLLVNVDGVAACESHAHRVLKAISMPIPAGSGQITLTASIGVTLFPDDASDAETLLRHADQAMYVAKEQGRNRYRLFDPEQDRQARSHRETLERIAYGIAHGEFRLHYQPKVDMRAGRILGFEALVRWQHPTQGLLGPGEFLPVINGTVLDIELGRWVLDEALDQLAAWRAMGFDFGVSVNVSGTHLLKLGFTDELANVLERHPVLERGSLEIEILETAAIVDLDAASEVLRECLRLGVSVALDDFGTGYSSLAYFRRLPVRTLKIDQVFISEMLEDPDDAAIVEGIIRFAKAFDRHIVAEGVQNAELGVLLLAMGCDVAQGHGIAAPMPPERVPEWARGYRPDPGWARGAAWHSNELPLLAAELHHRRWVDQLQAWLVSRGEAEAPPASDCHDCGFGRWYDTAGRERFGQAPSWEKAGRMHEAVHELARELADGCRQGCIDDVLERLPELLLLRDRLIACLREMRAPRPSGTANPHAVQDARIIQEAR